MGSVDVPRSSTRARQHDGATVGRPVLLPRCPSISGRVVPDRIPPALGGPSSSAHQRRSIPDCPIQTVPGWRLRPSDRRNRVLLLHTACMSTWRFPHPPQSVRRNRVGQPYILLLPVASHSPLVFARPTLNVQPLIVNLRTNQITRVSTSPLGRPHRRRASHGSSDSPTSTHPHTAQSAKYR